MNNERKLEEISEFCRKQKIDMTISRAYRNLSAKEAVRASKICNLLRWVLNPYADCLVNATLEMKKSEDVLKAKEIIQKYIKAGFNARLAFVGDYNYGKDSYGVVLIFKKDNEKSDTDMGVVLVVPTGQLEQFAETLNSWVFDVI